MKSINESIIDFEDVSNAVGAVSNILRGAADSDKETYLGGSISQYTKNLIMTFPVLCDNTISPETASLVNKANERNITTMLMLLFTAMNIEANSGMKVLSKIHKNITTNMDVYQVMDRMEEIENDIGEYAYGVSIESGKIHTVKGEYSKEREIIKEMLDELKYGKAKRFPVDSLNENSLNRFTIVKGYNDIVVREARDTSRMSDKEIVIMLGQAIGTSNDIYKAIDIIYNDPFLSAEQKTKKYTEFFNSKQFKKDIDKYIEQLDLDDLHITKTQLDRIKKEYDAELRKSIETEIKDRLENQSKQTEIDKNKATIKNLKLKDFEIMRNNVAKLVDTDVKKANELQPTVMQINYSQKTEDGFELRTFLAGVKSRLIAVDSMDIIERIIAKNKTKVNFLNFIRATTGEIKFFRDFLFAIDQAKLDSKNAVKKGPAAKLWNCLSNRATNNAKSKLKKIGNDASAITVLVISQETVNYMKSVHKFDIENIKNTKSVCENYNLMGIIIVDESIEVIKSFYAGNSMYEQLAFSVVQRENKDGDYKKVVNLLGRMNTR